MKIIKQIGIIFLVCWLSEVIEKFLPFAFPASVIGMALLLICLLTGVLKIEHIQEKADFLLENMAFFFVPAGVSIINYFDVLKNSVVQLIIICVVSTVVTFAVTAWSVKLTVRFMALTGRTGTGICFSIFWRGAQRYHVLDRCQAPAQAEDADMQSADHCYCADVRCAPAL